jgi:hypothetical protein
MSGFSTINLWYVTRFCFEYQSDINLPPLVGEISCTKHLIIIDGKYTLRACSSEKADKPPFNEGRIRY